MRGGGRAPRICGWGERVLRKRPSSPLAVPPRSFILRADFTTATATAAVTAVTAVKKLGVKVGREEDGGFEDEEEEEEGVFKGD